MSVNFDLGIRVSIEDDHELVKEFIQWQLDTKTWAFRGSSSGRGNSIDWFPVEHEAELREFFESRGIDVY